MDLRTLYRDSIDVNNPASAFYIKKSEDGWSLVLKEHKEQELPYTTDPVGVMFFASAEGKLTYNFLTKSDREQVQHHPAQLAQLMQQSGMASSECAPAVGSTAKESTPDSTHEAYTPSAYSHPSRSLAGKSDNALTSLYSASIDDMDKLREIQEELTHRSTGDALSLRDRVNTRIQRLLDQQSEMVNAPTTAVTVLSNRPYRDDSIQSLQQTFDRAANNQPVIEQLETELALRKTVKSVYLLALVRERLSEFKPVRRASNNQDLVQTEHIQTPASQSLSAPAPKITHSSPDRPWITKSITFLKRTQTACTDDLDTQKQLCHELSFRSTRQASLLKATVEDCIQVLNKSEIQSTDSQSADTLKHFLSQSQQFTARTSNRLKATETLTDIRENPAGQTLKNKLLLAMENSGEAGSLSPVELLERVLTRYRIEQDKRELSARLSTYKKSVLADKTPTPSQQAAFDQLDNDARELFLTKLEEEKAKQSETHSEEAVSSETNSSITNEPEEPYRKTPAMADLLRVTLNPAELARKAKERLEKEANQLATNEQLETQSRKSISLTNLLGKFDSLIAVEPPSQAVDNKISLKPASSEPEIQNTKPEALESPVDQTPVIELVVDLSIPYTKVQAKLQKELASTDFRMLLMRGVQDRQYNEIGQSLDMSRRDVRRRIKELVEEISEQHTDDLKAFSEPLDQFLDENEDDTSIEEAAAHLKLTGARLKFLTLISEPFFKQPCQVHKDRVYRKVQMLG